MSADSPWGVSRGDDGRGGPPPRYSQTIADHMTRLQRIVTQSGPLSSPNDRVFLRNLYQGVNMTPTVDGPQANAALARIYRTYWLSLLTSYAPSIDRPPARPNDAPNPLQDYILHNAITQMGRLGGPDQPHDQGAIAAAAFESSTYTADEARAFADQVAYDRARLARRLNVGLSPPIAPTATLSGPAERQRAIQRAMDDRLCRPDSPPFFILFGGLEPTLPGLDARAFVLLWRGNGPMALFSENPSGRMRSFGDDGKLTEFYRARRGALQRLLIEASGESGASEFGLEEIPLDAMPPALEDFVYTMMQKPDPVSVPMHPAQGTLPAYRFSEPFFGAHVDECDLVAAILSRAP